ncbi:MAG: succinyl-diaminopimelate desuccinylase [Rhodospirillaceae bacterium]
MLTSDTRPDLFDPLPIAQALIQRPSITPMDAGALDILSQALEVLGFTCHRLPFGDGDDRVDNLYARRGSAGPVFCYAGHTDVVPVDGQDWSRDPFAGEITETELIGRGAADMKGGIACFVAAVARYVRDQDAKGEATGDANGKDTGSIAFLITGDEEGPALNGTVKVLEWIEAQGEQLDHCLVGEPTNPDAMGDMIKIGRRGSTNMVLTIKGVPGHVAYPHLADNPIHRLVGILGALTAEPLDQGTDHFDPSSLQVTSVDVGNKATNVVPAEAVARLNIRFNDLHSGDSLEAWVRQTALDAFDGDADRFVLEARCSGEAFITPPGLLSDLISEACTKVTGRTPELSTSGGTSDARFIRSHCATAEFGLVGRTMHKADERVALSDLTLLADIYTDMLGRYFPRAAQG